jgi:hypothetical protein
MNNNFYTYAYLREDGTPYYIGKGKESRIIRKHRRRNKQYFNPPNDTNKIIFLKKNLTEEEAFKHEKYMIAVLGRKELGTGILRNMSNGGEGSSGFIMSGEARQKLSISHKGKKKSIETRMKMSSASKGRNLGRKHSEEAKKKMKGVNIEENSVHSKTYRITFSSGYVIEKCSIYRWAKDNGYSPHHIYSMAAGKRKKHKDIISVEKIENLQKL